MRLEVARQVAASPERVWAVLTDWERQPVWMLDARSVEILTPRREGVGVTLRCPTNLLGVTVQDVMRVTDWDPPRRLAITHLGAVITGSGAFELAAVDGGTHLRWCEQIGPPFGRLGEWGASRLAQPLLRRVFGRSLANLAGLAEAGQGELR